jgi:hypothetical protein
MSGMACTLANVFRKLCCGMFLKGGKPEAFDAMSTSHARSLQRNTLKTNHRLSRCALTRANGHADSRRMISALSRMR